MAKNRRPTRAKKPAADLRIAAPSRDTTRSCRYCKASIRPDYNFCAYCGMPTDPVNDRPLFVIEGLTNLFNVVFFESLMEQELNRAIRYGHALSVLVVEIDDLPALEAAYGYEETNRMIRSVGDAIANAIRDPDTIAATNRVAALGTQRFLVLLPHTTEEGAFRAAEKIRSLVGSTVLHLSEDHSVVTVSCGVAAVGSDRGVDANLVARATKALIESRSQGTNRIQVNTAV